MKFKTQGKGMSIDISFPCVFLLIIMFDRMKDMVPSRVMRKFVCRLWLNAVSQQ